MSLICNGFSGICARIIICIAGTTLQSFHAELEWKPHLCHSVGEVFSSVPLVRFVLFHPSGLHAWWRPHAGSRSRPFTASQGSKPPCRGQPGEQRALMSPSHLPLLPVGPTLGHSKSSFHRLLLIGLKLGQTEINCFQLAWNWAIMEEPGGTASACRHQPGCHGGCLS